MSLSPRDPQSTTPRRVLLIEDEEDLAHSIKYHLEKEGGLAVTAVTTGEDGLSEIRRRGFDLVLLDLMLPGMDGLEICKRLRLDQATFRIPIVMITARVEESDRIVGLEVGADDYITKPFSIRELLARVRAHLRREDRAAPGKRGFHDDLLEIDFEGHLVSVGGSEIALTHKEFDLLAALVRNRGRVLPRERLLQEVWGYQYFGETRTVDVHVFRLRHKLGSEAQARIETVVGIGYRYRTRDDS